jgi:hypothetical protein
MIDASLALQTALRARLAGFAILTAIVPAANILDHTGPAARYPSVLIGEGQTIFEEKVQTFERDMTRVYLDLHLWAKADDLAPVKSIAGAIRDAIRDAAPWLIEDHRLVDVIMPMIRFMRDRESETPLAHGVVTINALLQETK